MFGKKKKVWNPWEKKKSLESLGHNNPCQEFRVFPNNKNEQGLSADTGYKVIKSMQKYSHKQRQTWFWAAQAKPSSSHQARTGTLLHMTQIWQNWQCHIITAPTSPTQQSDREIFPRINCRNEWRVDFPLSGTRCRRGTKSWQIK